MIDQHGTLEISTSRVAANVGLFRRRLPAGTELCATVKANAYGHGLGQMLPALEQAGVRWTCVYGLREAMDVLRVTPEMRVLVLAPVVLTETTEIPDAALKAMTGGGVRIDLVDVASARRLAELLAGAGLGAARVHVQMDTGLTRAGVAREESLALVDAILALPTLKLEGIFSHLSHGDVPGHETVGRQVARLREITTAVRARKGGAGVMVHLQNSGGAWHIQEEGLDMVRVGVALYGLQPSFDDPISELQPVARLVAPILAIHARPVGVGVGYGHTFITKRTSKLAIVPVGYADGYPRALSNGAVAQLRGATAPVVGRVSMDQIIVDVTDVGGAEVGEMVTVMSWNPADANSVDRIAQACGTISYEIATGFGARLERKVVA